jgi:hypothetical protein
MAGSIAEQEARRTFFTLVNDNPSIAICAEAIAIGNSISKTRADKSA